MVEKNIMKMNKYKFIDEGKAHLHTINEEPLLGTSTVTGIIAKNLTWWAAETSAVECLESGEHIPTIRQEYEEAKKLGKECIDALQKKYPTFKKARFAHYEVKNKKAEQGTDLHSELEDFVVSMIKNHDGTPHETKHDNPKVQQFINWSIKNVKRFLVSEIHCYSERLWVGGICDVVWEMNDGTIVIGDFKSAPKPYHSHWVQIGGYNILLEENGGFDGDGNKIFELGKVGAYAVVPFGSESIIPQFRYDLEAKREAFECAVKLYKDDQNTK